MDLVQQLKDYHCISKQMHKEHRYEGTDELMIQLSELEIDILAYFGLPFATVFSEIMQQFGWERTINKRIINRLIVLLNKTATQYLLSTPKSNIEMLVESRVVLASGFNILPMMGFTTTTYNCFVFECMFIREGFEAEEVLAELELGEALSKDIQDARIDGYKPAKEALHKLQKKGLQYIYCFDDYLDSDNADIDVRAAIDCADDTCLFEFEYDTCLCLRTTYWEQMVLDFDSATINIRLYSKIKNLWVSFALLIDYPQFLQLILQCKQQSLSANIRTQCINFFEQHLPGNTDCLYIRENYECYLCCDVPMNCLQILDETENNEYAIANNAYVYIG